MSITLELEVAKKVVETAIENGAWSWDDGQQVNDELVVSTANSLVESIAPMKTENETALKILHIAGVVPAEEVTRAALERVFGPVANGSAPAAPPSEPAAAGAFADPSPALSAGVDPGDNGVQTQLNQEADVDIESIFPGYDDMKVQQIKDAVLTSAKSGDLTPDEWEQIKAYEESHEERKTILKLEPEFRQPEPAAPPSDGPEPSLEQVYDGAAPSRAQQEGLPIPQTPGGETPVIPIDITGVDDATLSRVATQFNSLFARTQWLLSQEEGRERAAEHLEREAHRDAYVYAYELHKNALPADKQGPTALDNARKLAERDADGAEPVRLWRSRAVRHGIQARELKALASGYDKSVWRINEELERRARSQTTGAGAQR